jgi:cytochrome c oxidase assembly protein subunit 15
MPFLILLWILGLAQGLMGWVMVKSGLTHDPHVSPYRLSAHLFLGFMIFAVALWMTLLLYKNKFSIIEHPPLSRKDFNLFKTSSLIALCLVLLTALFGALVAGLKAGLIYNTFPLMGETLIPRELLITSPWWKDLFENPVSVQFLHRLCAITTTLFCGGLWIYQHKLELSPPLSVAFNGMIICIFLQVSLGVLTLLFVVPPPLALLHQGVAFLLFGSLLYIIFLFCSSGRRLITPYSDQPLVHSEY